MAATVTINGVNASGKSFNPVAGWTLTMITDREDKKFSSGHNVTVGSSMKTIKNSNGIQMSLQSPENTNITDVTFYVVTNKNTEYQKGKLQEFEDESCNDIVESLDDFNNPTEITKTVANPAREITFTFGGKQVCFVAVVTYEVAGPNISASNTTPSFTTNLSTSIDAFTNTNKTLSVVAADYTTITWYEASSTTADPENDTQLGTGASYNFNKTTAGTYYVYCRAYNENATGEKYAYSNVATVTVAEPSSFAVTWSNTGGWSMRQVTVKGDATKLNSGVEEVAGTTLTFTADTGAGWDLKWYVNGVEKTQTSTPDNQSTLDVTIEGITNVEARYTARKKFTFTDNVKAKAYAAADGKITLSANNFSYSEGKTVDYWTDANSNEYYVGTEYTLTEDVALTPHFVDNKVALGEDAADVTWSFDLKNAKCPVFTSLQGNGNIYNYVNQTKVLGKSIDVNMALDATGGKIDNERRLKNTETQMNGGTKITVPVLAGSVVTIKVTGSLAADGTKTVTTISKGTLVLTDSNKTGQYTATAAGDVTITLGSNARYVAEVSVTYPDLSGRKFATWTADKTSGNTTLKLASKTSAIDNVSNLSDIALNGALANEGNGNTNASMKITTTTDKVAANFISMTFDVAAGYKFTPSLVVPNVVSVSKVKTYEVEISDAKNSVTFDKVTATSTAAAGEVLYLNPASATGLTGSVTVKMWVYGNADHYRIVDFKVAGETAVDDSPVDVTISAVQYSTFSAPMATTIPSGVTAYAVTVKDASTVTLAEIEDGVIPANTGVIVKGDAGTYSFVATATVGSATSVLTPVLAETAINAADYVLGNGSNGVGFYHLEEGNKLAANKAYLSASAIPAGAKFVGFNFGDDVTAVAGVAEAKASVKVAKFMKNGQLLIKTANGFVNAAGAQVK